VSSTANADVRLTGTSNSALLTGDVTVTKLAVTPGFDFGAYIEKSTQSIALTQSDTLASRLKLDLHVSTTPELQMQTAVAGSPATPISRCEAPPTVRNSGKGGSSGRRRHVQWKQVQVGTRRCDFRQSRRTQPIIDLQATTRVRDYDITVQFRGDASVTTA